jgi:hypothetical protein
MRKYSCRLAVLGGALLAVAMLATPAVAQGGCVEAGAPCAILVDNTGTFIEITNVGTAPKIVCHGRQDDLGGICDEAFSVCVKGRTEPEVAVLGTTAFGLLPAPDASCVPFIQILVATNKGTTYRTLFLTPTGTFGPDNTPVYNLNQQLLDLDGNPATPLQPLPQGSMVTVIMENRPDPACGRCIGVRTTIQHRFGTCKIWKTRKVFNVCSTAKTILAIREFERPCGCGTAQALPGPGGSGTATFSVNSTGEFITLAAQGSAGVPKLKAGSVDSANFVDEFFGCPSLTHIKPQAVTECVGNVNLLYLAVLLDYRPGGMTLKKNQEAFVSFHIDFE